MHSPKGRDKPRSAGRAYTAADLLVQIAQHEDHNQKQYSYVYCQSPSESAIYSASPAVTQNDSWPNRTRSRVLDSDSLFPPMFFPRDSLKRGSKSYSPAVVSSTKVTLGFRIFQIASVLIVGICLYALVDNILFLIRTNGDESYLQEESKRSSVNIHEQLQSWIIYGEENLGMLPRMDPSKENSIISSFSFAHSPSVVGSKQNAALLNHVVSVSSQNLTFHLNNSAVCSTVRRKSQHKMRSKNNNFVISSANRNIATSPSVTTTSANAEEGIYFMIVVHSAPDHFSERQAIRSTWGSVKSLQNLAIRLIFVLGKYHLGPNLALENSIRRENELFGDIVMGNFVDSYRNLTYKHLLGYKWIRNYCASATFVLKTDDDVFIDLPGLFDFISRTYGFAPQPGTLICNVFPEGTKPVRSKSSRGSKWSVTMDEYPHSVYPRYCGGLAYLATPDVIAKILDVSDRVKFFWIDDVFVTGILREIAEIEPFYLNLRYLYDPEEYRAWLLPAGTLLPSEGSNNNNSSKKGSSRDRDDYYDDDKKSKKRLRKFPFLFAHIERGDKFSEEMNDLWRKALRSWSQR